MRSRRPPPGFPRPVFSSQIGRRSCPQRQVPKRPSAGIIMTVTSEILVDEVTARMLALACVILVGGCSSREAPAGPPKPHVSVANPIVREVIDWDEYVGRFGAVQGVTVMSRVPVRTTENVVRKAPASQVGQSR